MSKSSGDFPVRGVLVAGVAALALLGGCGRGAVAQSGYSAEDAVAYAEQSGYSDVEVTGSSVFLVNLQGCDKSDTLKYDLTGTAPNGTHAELIICKGVFKRPTIRG